MTPDSGGISTARGAARPVQRELRDFLRFQELRRRQLPRAILVGVVAGLVAVGFLRALEAVDRLRAGLLERAHALGDAGVLLPIVIFALGAAVAVHLVVRYAPEAGGSGIPHLKAVLHRLRTMSWRTLLPVKFAGGVIGIGSGFALGREGPTVQMGGAVGQMVGGWFRCTPRERKASCCC